MATKRFKFRNTLNSHIFTSTNTLTLILRLSHSTQSMKKKVNIFYKFRFLNEFQTLEFFHIGDAFTNFLDLPKLKSIEDKNSKITNEIKI